MMFVALLLCSSVSAESKLSVAKQTFVYAEKDGKQLLMDSYRLEGVEEIQPAVIFLFGGGFRRGVRDSEGFLSYFRFLAENGFTVFSIDYRLGLQDVKRTEELLFGAVRMAVEDLFDATAYIIHHAKALGINPELITINGSSAGGITALQGLYEIDKRGKLTEKLPAGFNYAGVIAFSGAIITREDLAWKHPVAPVMLFHGDADPIVPYDEVVAEKYRLHGSNAIARSLNAVDQPFWFLSFSNEGHNITGMPRSLYRDEILKFLNQMVILKRPWIINTEVRTIGNENQHLNSEARSIITPDN